MPSKRPNNQDIAGTFMDTPVYWGGNLIRPREDMLFHENERAFYVYNKAVGAWEIVPNTDKELGALAQLINNFLLTSFPDLNVTNQTIGEVRDAIGRSIPRRFNEDRDGVPNVTAFSNGLFDWKTFELVPHDKGRYAFHGFTFPYKEEETPTPEFDKYLARAFKADQEMVDFIPSMLGYYLMPSSREPAAFYVYGPARAGKSVMLDLVREMIGDRFTCSFSLQSLTMEKFSLAELAGYRVNIQDEDESEFIAPDKLKALVSQAKMQGERKFGAPFTFRPRCKFLFGSNQMPNFKSVDDGLRRRLHFIEFKYPLTKAEQDKFLIEKLKLEMPGIVTKAIREAKAFILRGEEFIMPESLLAMAERFANETDPVLSFFYEKYVVHDPPVGQPGTSDPLSTWTLVSKMYDDYKDWAKSNGRFARSKFRFIHGLDSIPNLSVGRSGMGDRYRSCLPLKHANIHGDGNQFPTRPY